MSDDDDTAGTDDHDVTPAPEIVVSAPRKTVEEWATAKGYLPAETGGGTYALPPGARGRVTQVNLSSILPARRRNPLYGRFLAAKAQHAWPDGQEMTEQEFDAAIDAAHTMVSR